MNESMPDSPRLGLATTEELYRELIARHRCTSHGFNDPGSVTDISRAIQLAEMLGGLSACDREYRTVDAS